MLGHANSDPFQRHYLGREISADPMAIIRGLRPQQALMKQSYSIGHSISQRRPLGLTRAQSLSVCTNLEVAQLKKNLENLPQGSIEHINVRRRLRNLTQSLQRGLKQKIRAGWTNDQAIEDIERQLRGDPFADTPAGDDIRRQLPAQQRLIAAITAPASTTIEGECQRRDRAIEAVIAYCALQEGPTVRSGTLTIRKIPHSKATRDQPEDSPAVQAAKSVIATEENKRPRKCFLCVGAALSLEPDDPSIEELIREFHSPTDLSKHFQRRHLKLLLTEKLECLICQQSLSDKTHLQNHALKVHGTLSKP